MLSNVRAHVAGAPGVLPCCVQLCCLCLCMYLGGGWGVEDGGWRMTSGFLFSVASML